MRHSQGRELTPATREEKSLGAAVDVYTHPESGSTVRIRLNKDTLEFGALVNGEQITDKDGEALRKKVAAAIEKSLALVWIPLIEIEVSNPEREDRTSHFFGRYETEMFGAQCKVRYCRFFVAHVEGQTWRRLEWELGVDEKKGPSAKLSASADWGPPGPREPHFGFSYNSDRAKAAEALRAKIEARANWKPPYFSQPDPDDRHDTSLTHTLAFDSALWTALEAMTKLLLNAQGELNKLLGSKKGIAAITQGAGVRLLGAGAKS